MLRILAIDTTLVNLPAEFPRLVKHANDVRPHVAVFLNLRNVKDVHSSVNAGIVDAKTAYFQGRTDAHGRFSGVVVTSAFVSIHNHFFEKIDGNTLDCLITRATFKRPETEFDLFAALSDHPSAKLDSLSQEIGDFMTSSWNPMILASKPNELSALIASQRNLVPATAPGHNVFWLSPELISNVNKLEPALDHVATLLEINIK